MADYKLKFTAAEIDKRLDSIDNKQDKLTGTEGQVVGFDANGNTIVTDDYKNAILLDDGALKNSSGEDVTNNIVSIILDRIPNAEGVSF